MAGLTTTGFVRRTVDELRVLMEDGIRARLGADVDVSAESLPGQIIAVCATSFGELWEAAEAVYAARDPRSATGAALEVCAALAPGITRRAATKGTVTLRLNVSAGDTVPAGSVAHVAGEPSARWVTTEAAVNGTGSAANFDVEAEAELAGRYLAPTGTITVIATPVSGWNSVTNPDDADAGLEIESYPALRVRRQEWLQRAGSTPLAAFAAQVAETAGVTHVVAWENASAFVDDDGRPPHTLEAMVLGGTDAAVAAAVWAAKAAGIGTHGDVSETVTDANGQSRTVRFSRPADLDIYCIARVTVDADTYAGDAEVGGALLEAGDAYLTGDEVRISDLVVAVRAVTGVIDVVILLGTTSGGERNANVSVGVRQRAAFDSARVTVERV